MAHNCSPGQRSRWQGNDDGPQVPTYSEALIQLNGDGSGKVDSTGRCHNYGTSPRNSSQSHEGVHSGKSTMNADHQSRLPNTNQSEVQKLRSKDAVNAAIIKMLKQELNVKDYQIEQINEKQKHDDEVINNLTTRMEELMRNTRQRAVPKLPDFTGSHSDEKFEIWITRFNEALYRFNSSEKLDALLPRLRGIAADFVFDQLSPEIRSDYHALVYELRKRFQTFETPRMYQAQYDRRRQNSGESAHSFASDLKRLYDKAYPRRPRSIRDEDLVRKFFDGLLDRRASTQVEYHKNPSSIDHAVYEVIRYMDIIGGPWSTSNSSGADLN